MRNSGPSEHTPSRKVPLPSFLELSSGLGGQRRQPLQKAEKASWRKDPSRIECLTGARRRWTFWAGVSRLLVAMIGEWRQDLGGLETAGARL